VSPSPSPQPTVSPQIPPHTLETLRFGRGSAEVLARSPDGGTYVVGGSLGLHVYDSAFKEVASYPIELVQEILFSHDGSFLAVAAFDRVLMIDLRDGNLLLNTTTDAYEMALSADDDILAYAFWCSFTIPDCPDSVHVWSIASGKTIAELLLPFQDHVVSFRDVAISPNSALVAAAGSDGVVYLWDLQAQLLIGQLRGHLNEVAAVAFSPDGNLLASSSDDGTIRIWELNSAFIGRVLARFDSPIASLSFSTSGEAIIAQREDGSDEQWALQTGASSAAPGATPYPEASVLPQLKVRDGYIGSVGAIAYSPDGRTIAVADDYSPAILFFDAESGISLGAADCPATDFVFSAQGNWLVATDDEGNMCLIDAANGRLLKSIMTTRAYALALSPDDHTVALAGDDSLEVWDLETSSLAFSIPDPSLAPFLSFSPDGDSISAATGEPFGVASWSVPDGRALSEFRPMSDPDYRRAVALDGRTLALFEVTDFFDNSVDLWNFEQPGSPTTLNDVDDYAYINLEFSPDGSLAVVGFFYGVSFYDRQSGRLIYRYDEEVVGPEFAFSPDGLSLAVGDGYGSIVVWDISTIATAAR
jgi:WD40 repeat protein